MNIEKWLDENALWSDNIGDPVVTESKIFELLKTHAIVPRAPTKRMMDAADAVDFYTDDTAAICHNVWNTMIAESESENV